MSKKTSLFDKTFRNQEGKVVLFEKPNIAILIAFAAWLVQFYIQVGIVHNIAQIIFLVALAVWAVLEIGWGTNYFRRALGLIVLVFIGWEVFRQLMRQ